MLNVHQRADLYELNVRDLQRVMMRGDGDGDSDSEWLMDLLQVGCA